MSSIMVPYYVMDMLYRESKNSPSEKYSTHCVFFQTMYLIFHVRIGTSVVNRMEKVVWGLPEKIKKKLVSIL